MTLLEALVADIKAKRPGITHARMVYFAVGDDTDDIAYLSEITLKELIPLIERWLVDVRAEIGTIQ